MGCSECGGMTLPGRSVCRDCAVGDGGGLSRGIAAACLGTAGVGVWAAFLGTILVIIPNSIFVSILGVALIAVGIAQFAVAYGLWTARPWAWNAAIVLHGANALAEFVNFVVHDHWQSLIALAASGAIAAYVYATYDPGRDSTPESNPDPDLDSD